MSMRAVAVVLMPLLAACGSTTGVEALDEAPAAGPRVSTSAEQSCREAAVVWGGLVAASFDVTVQGVRDHMSDPHGAGDDPAAPRPGDYSYPPGWEQKQPADSAAVCYLDGPVPKGPPPALDGTVSPSFDRRLVMAAADVESFMVSAGYKDAMPLEPLPR
jgi:hypothetical protein